VAEGGQGEGSRAVNRIDRPVAWDMYDCNDPTIGSYNHYHLSPNGIPRGNQTWYGLVYLIQIAGKPRIRPRE